MLFFELCEPVNHDKTKYVYQQRQKLHFDFMLNLSKHD